MSKRITYQLCSNDANKFNEVEFQPIIPWNCNRIKYRVKSVNTFANFLITNNDDVLNVYDDDSDKQYQLNFKDRVSYEMDDLLDVINNYDGFPLTVDVTDSGCIRFNIKESYSEHDLFIESSTTHRVKLLLGIWCESNTTDDGDIPVPAAGYIAPCCPMLCYNNVLYLQSIHGNQMCSRIDRTAVSPSILYRINTFMKSNLPIILNKEKLGEEVEVNYDALNATSIKIKLVDFQFEDVLLKSPLFICLEIEPVENSMIQFNY